MVSCRPFLSRQLGSHHILAICLITVPTFVCVRKTLNQTLQPLFVCYYSRDVFNIKATLPAVSYKILHIFLSSSSSSRIPFCISPVQTHASHIHTARYPNDSPTISTSTRADPSTLSHLSSSRPFLISSSLSPSLSRREIG